jgi:hypothetical protein
MSALIGFTVLAGAFVFFSLSLIALRNPARADLVESDWISTVISIVFVGWSAVGIGYIVEFASGLSGTEAVAALVGSAVALPVIATAVWRVLGGKRRLLAFEAMAAQTPAVALSVIDGGASPALAPATAGAPPEPQDKRTPPLGKRRRRTKRAA